MGYSHIIMPWYQALLQMLDWYKMFIKIKCRGEASCSVFKACSKKSLENNTFLASFTFVVVVQSLSRVQLFATPWTAEHQTSLSFTISRSLLKLMSIKSVMPSNHLILCLPLLLLSSIFPSIWVFSNEVGLCIGTLASVLLMNIQG